VQSAFGYQGQKCSACSRAIVSQKVYDNSSKNCRAHEKDQLRPSEDPNNFMGPVVRKSAMTTILGYIDVGKKEGKLLHGGDRAPGDGYFVQPTIIAGRRSKARISRKKFLARC